MAGLGQDTGGIRKHAYYQWVPLVLTLQAAMFSCPYYLWKVNSPIPCSTQALEGGRLEAIVMSLHREAAKPRTRQHQRRLSQPDSEDSGVGEEGSISEHSQDMENPLDGEDTKDSKDSVDLLADYLIELYR